MSIIVKGMEMPKNCWECALSDIDDDFGRCCLFSGIACLTIGRQDNCPLIEIPPHGDLVDRDAMIAEYDHQHKGPAGGARRIMEQAKTVIEAEGVTE